MGVTTSRWSHVYSIPWLTTSALREMRPRKGEKAWWRGHDLRQGPQRQAGSAFCGQACLCLAGVPWCLLANPGSSALHCFGGSWPFLGGSPARECCSASSSFPALLRVSIPLPPQLTGTEVQESGSLLRSGAYTLGALGPFQQGASAVTFSCLGFLN